MKNEQEKLCPKCDGAMDIGAIAHVDAPYRLRVRWIKGTPKPGFWGKGPVKVQDREHPLTAYVCGKCGFTEIYTDLDQRL